MWINCFATNFQYIRKNASILTFFLRKAFSSGPIRLNLSKSGLGLSVGVTGARVGLGPRGAYVAGGRHGIYYRESLSSHRRRRNQAITHSGDEVVKFVDTGLTFKNPLSEKSVDLVKIPLLPGVSPVYLYLIPVGFLLLFSEVALLGVFLMLFSPALYFFFRFKNQIAIKRAKKIADLLEQENPVTDLENLVRISGLKGKSQKWLEYNFFEMLNRKFYENPDYILPEELLKIQGNLTLESSLAEKIKAKVLSEFTDKLVEDHLISKEEEAFFEDVCNQLKIQQDLIKAEIYLIKSLSKLRDEMHNDLVQIEFPFSPVKNESCFFLSEGKLLNERIINRYQRNKIIYKDIGYQVDLEGTIYLTNKRIGIEKKGYNGRSYNLNRVQDVILSLEDHTVQVVLDDRKNPLIFTVPELAVFSGRLERLTSMQAS